MNILVDSQFSTSTKAVTDNGIATYENNTYRANIHAQKAGKTDFSAGYSLDIADKVMENEAYTGHGLTADEIMQQAGNTDTQVQKDFMVVMSSCVSGEDFQKMQEEGFKPGSTDVETYVSIVDKIKVTLAKAGVEISGYNDDIDAEKIEEITGSKLDANRLAKDMSDMFKEQDIPVTDENIEQLAKAVMKASDIGPLSEDTLKYMLINKKQPTISNLYKAQFSSAAGLKQSGGYYSEGAGNYGKYFSKKAYSGNGENAINWDNLKTQMDTVISQAGLAADEKTASQAFESAKWLVQSGIELNAKNLQIITQLNTLKLPLTQEDALKLCMTALGNGKSPEKALITGEKAVAEQAKEIIETVNSISDKAIHNTIESGTELNIKNLAAAQRQIDIGNASQIQNAGENTYVQEGYVEEASINQTTVNQSSIKEIEAKRQLEEIRLMMTEDANRFLLKKGISVNTTELSKLVENLKNAEKSMRDTLFKGTSVQENAQRVALYDETLSKTGELKRMPLALMGKAASNTHLITLSGLHKEGKELQNQLENQNNNSGSNQGQQRRASESYEALMTTPRKDLGDRISKAFRNVDDILKTMGLETSQANQRAVRILAYNRMEITDENLNAVKLADSKVCDVINKMTPATTLNMIREGINPLEMSIDELEKYLNENVKATGPEIERFSKFLHKLDRSGQITEQEREAYIGIYRMFNQIEKSDGAVIGNLVATGAQINFKNMLSAVRSKADKNMDIHIDDNFGGLEKLITKGKAIDTQIMSGYEVNEQTLYYARLSSEINDELTEKTDLEKLDINNIKPETTIEEFADNIKDLSLSQQAMQEKVTQELKEFQNNLRDARQVDEGVIQTLMDYGQAVNLDNIEAATMLITQRGSLFRQLFGAGKSYSNNGNIRADEEVADNTSDISENRNLDKMSNDSLWDAADRLVENLKDSDSADVAYQELINEAGKAIENMVSVNGVTYLDVKAAQSLYKGLSLAGGFAKEENYEIPININGEITSLNLKLCHNKAGAGKVAITMDTDSIGKVAAEFNVGKDSISGMIVCENVSYKEQLENIETFFKETMSDINSKSLNISVIHSKNVDLSRFGEGYRAVAENTDTSQTVSTTELYQLAKTFIMALKA